MEYLYNLVRPMAIYPTMVEKVIYHLLTDRFWTSTFCSNPLGFQGGVYTGIITHIRSGFFKELGVTHLQISPPYEQVVPQWDNEAQRYDCAAHGYWPTDHTTRSSRFGNLEVLLEVAEAHGLKVIFDMVHHVGVGARLFQDHPDWFTSSRTWFWNLPELNLARADVRAYVFAALQQWNPENKHVYRWDTLHHLPKGYVHALFSAEDSPATKCWSVGEVLHGDTKMLQKFLELGTPSVYNYPLFYCFSEELSFTAGNLGKVADTFGEMFASGKFHASQLVNFAQNHDMDLLRCYHKEAPADESLKRLKMALNLVFFVPGIPSVYYLDSTGWTGQNFSDPNRSGRWCLEWPAEQGVLHRHLCCLSRVRKNTPALTFGTYQELWRPGELNPAPIFAFERRIGGNGSVQVIVVVVNNDTHDHEVAIPVEANDADALEELLATEQDFIIRDRNLIGRVAATSVLALELPSFGSPTN
jgi:neopullulanase